MPTFGDRHALTIWYYDTEERKNALDLAKKAGKAAKAASSTIEEQQQAKEFISNLLDGDESDADAELQRLLKKLETLSDASVEIISNITGAASVSAFREGFSLLVPQDLDQMRALFRNMGLQ